MSRCWTALPPPAAKNVEGQLDLFGMAAPSGRRRCAEIPLPDIPEFTAVERMIMEKETTGLYLSGHPMADYRALARRAGAVPIHTILADFAAEDGPVRFADGQSITIAGVVTASRTRTTRNNALMAYVTIEDELASIELLCFSRVIDQCGSYMQVNTPVLVKGRLSVRDEKPPQIMCDSLYPLESGLPPAAAQPARRPAQKESTIYLRFPSADSPAFRHIKLVMTMFEGGTPVKIRLADTGKLLGTHCLNHPALLQECREWLGSENVVVKPPSPKNEALAACGRRCRKREAPDTLCARGLLCRMGLVVGMEQCAYGKWGNGRGKDQWQAQ